MSKEHFMAAHDALVEEYLDANPDATWEQAYEATADGAWDRMRGHLPLLQDGRPPPAPQGGLGMTRARQTARIQAAADRDLTLRPVRDAIDWDALDRIAAFAAERRAEMGEERWAELDKE